MRADRVYAYLLKTYPASWRTRHGEEVLAVLSQAADDRGTARPDLHEAASLLVNGARERFGLLPAGLTPFARELTSTSALASLAALALLCVAFGEWWPWGDADPYSSFEGPEPFRTVAGPLYAVMLLPWVLAVAGRTHAARVLLVTVLGGLALVPLVARASGLDRPPVYVLLPLVLLTALAMLVPVRRRALLLVQTSLLAAAMVIPGMSNIDPSFDPRGNFYYAGILRAMAPWVVGVVVLALIVFRGRHFVPVLLVSVPWLLLAAGSSKPQTLNVPTSVVMAAAVAGAVATALLAVRLARSVRPPDATPGRR